MSAGKSGENVNSTQNPEEIRVIAKSFYENCRGKQADCFENEISNKLLAKYKISDILDAVYDYDTYFSCHAFTHFLGRAIYRKLGNIPDSYANVNFTCHGGAFHGVMEAYLEQRKVSVESLSGEDIEATCKDSKSLISKEPEQIYFECFHGFGHAFMFITDADLLRSLKYCDKMNDISFREACYGGALMENSTSSTNTDHKSVWLKADDKFYPCTILEEKYLNQCYFYQSNYWIMVSNHDYVRTFSDCYRLGGVHRDYCILGLGANLASLSNEKGMEAAASVCNLGINEYKYICIEGAIPSIADRYGGELSKVVEYCQMIAPDLKEFCFGKLGQVATRWKKSEKDIDKICANVENYHDACIGKANLEFKY